MCNICSSYNFFSIRVIIVDDNIIHKSQTTTKYIITDDNRIIMITKEYLNRGLVNNSSMRGKKLSPDGNSLHRTSKKGPITGLNASERLERYSVLFNFKSDKDIDTLGLAEQWEVHRRARAHSF